MFTRFSSSKLRIFGQYFDSNNFQEKVNSGLDYGERYSLEVSPRIGRNKAKEQYAFFYAANRFKVCFYLQKNILCIKHILGVFYYKTICLFYLNLLHASYRFNRFKIAKINQN